MKQTKFDVGIYNNWTMSNEVKSSKNCLISVVDLVDIRRKIALRIQLKSRNILNLKEIMKKYFDIQLLTNKNLSKHVYTFKKISNCVAYIILKLKRIFLNVMQAHTKQLHTQIKILKSLIKILQ